MRLAALAAALLLTGCVEQAAETPKPGREGVERASGDHRAISARVAPQRAPAARTGPSGPQLDLLCPMACPKVTRFDELIERSARRNGLGSCAWKAQLCQESSLRPDVCSDAGACGLPQLLEGTARDLGVRDRFDPAQAVPAGARYQAWQQSQWGRYGRSRCEIRANARAGYNWGLGNVLRCQRERGGLHLRDWKDCVPTETWHYASHVAAMAGEPDCIGGPS